MTHAKPPLLHLSELASGQSADFFVLLAERTRGTTRDGKPYYLCKFRDARRSAAVMVWLDGGRFEDCEQQWHRGEFFKIRGTYRESERYGPQIEIQQIRPVQESDRVDGFDPTDLVDRSRFDGDAMLSELRTVAAKHIADEPLRRLVLTILDRHGGDLKRLPASRDKHYTFAGGLLEHTLAVTSLCINLAETYAARYTELEPPLNRDLVIAGAVLHDIGRVLELGSEPLSPQPTVPGRLLGHLVLGRDLVRDTAKELADLRPELVQLLEHLILTHLELPEGGAASVADGARSATRPPRRPSRHRDGNARALLNARQGIGPVHVQGPGAGEAAAEGPDGVTAPQCRRPRCAGAGVAAHLLFHGYKRLEFFQCLGSDPRDAAKVGHRRERPFVALVHDPLRHLRPDSRKLLQLRQGGMVDVNRFLEGSLFIAGTLGCFRGACRGDLDRSVLRRLDADERPHASSVVGPMP